uniref:Helicase ATP-binding domain-containing protein n=1 Tax=viral metagenome TaxID=1070528 RepID=A0A6C0J570_9ZZZZ
MLTLRGYRVAKKDVNVADLKKELTVRPYIPSAFVKPHLVPKYPVFQEDAEFMYVPKHFGLDKFGKVPARDVEQTHPSHWTFVGSIRPVQQVVVDSFLKPEPHDGLISLQTGGGKTVCALYIASQLRLPTLVIVHNTFLRDQWEERIKAFLPNAVIGRVQADKVEVVGCDFVIAMLQTLSMREIDSAVFQNIGLVIVDECHHIASEVFVQSLPKITSKYMLGLSATPERKDKLMYVINWFLGPMLYKSDMGDSVDTAVKVEVYEYENYDTKFNEIIYSSQGLMSAPLMINKLAECEDRTQWLARILEDVIDEGRQILVLSDRVQHCLDLQAALTPELREKTGILGQGVKADKRAELMATKSILIATYSMCKEGFDLATLNTLMMATPRPDIDQIVGRILRVEKSKRTMDPIILDIVDPQFRNQFQQRMALYRKRQYSISKLRLPSPEGAKSMWPGAK